VASRPAPLDRIAAHAAGNFARRGAIDCFGGLAAEQENKVRAPPTTRTGNNTNQASAQPIEKRMAFGDIVDNPC